MVNPFVMAALEELKADCALWAEARKLQSQTVVFAGARTTAVYDLLVSGLFRKPSEISSDDRDEIAKVAFEIKESSKGEACADIRLKMDILSERCRDLGARLPEVCSTRE